MAKLDNSEVEIANIIQSGNFDELKNLQKTNTARFKGQSQRFGSAFVCASFYLECV